MQKLCFSIALCCMVVLCTTIGNAQVANITRVEYYVDKDPGYGKATQLTITAATSINGINITINPANYAAGVHAAGVRALNANGKWSIDNKWLFAKPYAIDSSAAVTNIARVEYYIDKDPGYGKATALSITAGTTLSNVAINLNPAVFTNSIHLLGVRALNTAGMWGHDNKWLFVKPYAEDTVSTSLAATRQVEYYIDNDPGYGKATQVVIDTGSYNLSNINIAVNVSGLAAASHTLFVRARNAKGNWSLVNKYGFKVTAAIAAPSIVINRVIRRAAYCAKDTLAFSYDAAGTFNAGNVFTVQLGDSTGNFTNPVTAGTFTATGDSIVKMLLPAHITDGKYRLRIISSSPAVTGVTSTDTLLIRDAPRAVAITGDSAVNIADVNTYSVSSTTGYTWKWAATNTTAASSANTASLKWAVAGMQTIKVSAVNQYGCKGDTSVKTVIVYPFRIDSVFFSKLTPCPGDSITISAKVTGAYKAGNVFTAQLSDSAGNFGSPVKIGSLSATPVGNLVTINIKAALPYTLLNSNRYRLRVTGSNPADTSVAATTAYLQVQKPALGKDSVIIVCAPARLNLGGIYNTTGLTTAWNIARPDSVVATGNYQLIVTNTYGCRDTALVIVTVNARPNLGKDTTVNTTGGTVNLTTLYNTSGFNATWSTTTPASAGAGTYTLIVTNSAGCRDTAIATVKVIANMPVINSFTPATAAAGITVTIKGKYFTGTNTVKFGGVAAASFNVLSDSVITAVTGNGASGAVTVTTGAGTSTLGGFTFCTPVSPSVSIASNAGSSICAGTKVTFTATPVNGGSAPVYQWYKNNIVVGANNVTYTDSLLKNGDSVWAVLTSNAACLAATTAKSNVLKLSVSAKVAPSVSIASNTAASICAGTKVSFTATPVNGGSAPVYQWYKNNIVVGANNVTYTDSLLKNGDSVWAVLTSNAACLAATTAKSNVLKLSVSAKVAPSVTIASNTAASICAGTKVTFTAIPVNGGSAPVYQWYKNNIVVGANNVTYTDSLLKNGDSVWAVLTSNASCLAATTAKSNVFKLTVSIKPALGKDTSLSICPGSAVNIKNLYNTTTGYTAVNWNTTRPDSVTVAGTYSLIVTNSGGCKDTALVTITKLTTVTPVITKTGNTTFCLSDSLVLTTNATGNLQWYRNNSAIKLASNSRYVVKIAGVYMVKATNVNGCAAASDTVAATVLQIPKPAITLTNDTLVSSALTGNQWFQGGVSIKGAIGQKYSPNDIDVYTVQVTSGGCKSPMSDGFVYTANTFMKNSSKASLLANKAAPSALIYPNPATDIAYVKLEGFEGAVLITVCDMTGRVVWQQNKLYNATYSIPLTRLAAGMYTVTISDSSNKRSFKLVRAK